MFLRMLSVMLIAVAMLAAPLPMREDAVTASAPKTAMHQGDAAQMPGHCDEQGNSRQDQTHKARGGNCCVATCVAVMAPVGVADLPDYHPLAHRPASDADRIGTLLEIATPPPRRA